MTIHWVDEFLVPLHACQSGIDKARQYPDPQSAWDNWDDGCELLWTLGRRGAQDKQKLALCACDIAERVLPLFEEEYPEDMRPRMAIEAARRWAENPTEENLNAAAAAAADAADASDDVCIARVAANAAANAACHAADAADDTDYADYATSRAAYYAVDAAAAAANAYHGNEVKAQADIVRKYFPISPFVRKENNQE